jgi:DNA-binding winged helix-turn-helix (wHTH) protein/tetratricopeptide (TPR) repeat protein
MGSKGSLAFPPFRLDVADERLWRGTQAVPLTPKALAVLRYLVEKRGRLVTKDELLNTVWPGVHVGDAVLKSCVLEIRRAMDDHARSPKFIETVHRRGYRFVAEPPRDETPTELAGHGAKTPARHLPVVGRERELARLRACLERALGGQGQLVVVTGEPGIGKTTLVEAFLRDTARDQLHVAWGQCIEHAGAGEAYLPVLHALSRLCRGPAGERLVPVLRKYAPTWLAQMPSLIDPEDRAALQREIFGATPDRMLREMAEAVEPLTAEVPLVLVLEDLHWSDPATVDLLASLARRRDAAHLLVVGTFRDTEIDGHQHPLRTAMHELHTHRLCEEIHPRVLDEADVDAYLAARFPAHRFPEGLGHVIHERTDGNPLFLTDVVDDLVRQGSIVQAGDGWDIRKALEEIGLSVPESLRHMIDRQLDRLNPDEQRLLEAASVSGEEFSVPEIAAALDAGAEQVEAWSDQLVRRHQFIEVAGVEQLPGATVTSRYGFIHSLYRHAIDARLSGALRARLHQRIGEQKEAGRGDRAAAIAPELATHFEEARDHRRAIHYLTQAADHAVRRCANRTAVGYLSRALAVAERGPEEERTTQRMLLLERLGRVRRLMGDMKGAAEDFAAWATLAHREGRTRDEVRALLYQSGALSWIDRERSVVAAGQAVARSGHLGDPLLHARALGHQAFGHLLARGWHDEEARACTEAMESARRAGDRYALNLHVSRCAYLLCHRSQYQAAVDTADEGLHLSVEFHDPFHYMSCQFHRGWALLHQGKLGQALFVFTDGLQMAERNGHRPWARVFRFGMAWVHEQAFDFEGARSLCERELDRTEEPLLGRFLGLIVLGRAHLGLGDHRRALHILGEIIEQVERGHALMDWILRMPLHLALAACRRARGELEAARSEAEQLSDLAARPPERTYLALGGQMLAEIALAEHDDARAEAELSKALAALDGAEAPLAEWRVHETAARLRTRRKQMAPARRHRARSAATLTRLIDSLHDWPELQGRLRSGSRVQAVLGERRA